MLYVTNWKIKKKIGSGRRQIATEYKDKEVVNFLRERSFTIAINPKRIMGASNISKRFDANKGF